MIRKGGWKDRPHLRRDRFDSYSIMLGQQGKERKVYKFKLVLHGFSSRTLANREAWLGRGGLYPAKGLQQRKGSFPS